jgi:hypothetical protein
MMMTMRGFMADTADVTTHLLASAAPARSSQLGDLLCNAMHTAKHHKAHHVGANNVCTRLDDGNACTIASSAHDAVTL